MQTAILVLAVISMLCSAFTSCVYAYIAWKKSKEPPKDEAWEAAIRLMCAKDFTNAEQFAELYEELTVYTNLMGKKNADQLFETYLALQKLKSEELQADQDA